MASNQTTLPNVSENEETLLTGVNENVYEDQSIGAELTKKDINRVAWRSMLLQASFNYERMQASGWLYGLLPALKKIHTNAGAGVWTSWADQSGRRVRPLP